MAKKYEEIDLETALKERFDRWDDIYKNGANDPFWPDGVNLDFVRNHILYYKSEIEKNIKNGEYPEIYYRDVPPKIDSAYMARADEIRVNAEKTLKEFESSKNLSYLRRKIYAVDKSCKELNHAKYLVESSDVLSDAIQNDDLITMRRYENIDAIIAEINNCAEKLREYIPSKNIQLNLFDISDTDNDIDLRL